MSSSVFPHDATFPTIHFPSQVADPLKTKLQKQFSNIDIHPEFGMNHNGLTYRVKIISNQNDAYVSIHDQSDLFIAHFHQEENGMITQNFCDAYQEEERNIQPLDIRSYPSQELHSIYTVLKDGEIADVPFAKIGEKAFTFARTWFKNHGFLPVDQLLPTSLRDVIRDPVEETNNTKPSYYDYIKWFFMGIALLASLYCIARYTHGKFQTSK